PTIVITPLGEEVRPAIEAKVLSDLKRTNPDSGLTVPAGEHTVRYRYAGEIRFGPALYDVEITGPHGGGITRRWLRGHQFVFAHDAASPYNVRRDWLLLHELAKDE